jgi:hypothetical protein
MDMSTKSIKSGHANTITLMIKGSPVEVTYESVQVSNIVLDPDNPRIRLQVHRKFGKSKPSAKDLIDIVRSQPGFSELQRTIRVNNGLHDPLIVRHKNVVAEGNSRTVVLLVLGTGSPEDKRWHSVPIMRLPAGIPESVIASLLASYHVGGKTPWRAYAKAEHIYHLKNTHGLTVDEISHATRMSSGSVEQHLVAFEYFQNELAPGADPDVLESKFSHALELMKGKKLAAIRDDPAKRKLATDLIRDNKLSGHQVRHLDKYFDNKPAVAALRKGHITAATKAVEATNPTVASKFLKKMQDLEESLSDLPRADIETLQKNDVAAQILIRLHGRILEIAAVAKIDLGAKYAAPRANRG